MSYFGEGNTINTKWFVLIICLIVIAVFGCYLFNFNDQMSDKNEVLGTFGDYVGGILNPVIAAFAFYLIAKTYELQKVELEESRKLLEISTRAQNAQVKLAALTTLHNLNLTRISQLEINKMSLYEREARHRQPFSHNTNEQLQKAILGTYGLPETYSQDEMDSINSEINRLKSKNAEIETQIEEFDL